MKLDQNPASSVPSNDENNNEGDDLFNDEDEDIEDLGDSLESDENDDSKPFDSEPFDADVEADEDEDPEKFIQQLAGKLATTLRKFTNDKGEPDFELEKFAINSVISATNTSEMDEEDKKDIVKKVNTSKSIDNEDDENGDVSLSDVEDSKDESIDDLDDLDDLDDALNESWEKNDLIDADIPEKNTTFVEKDMEIAKPMVKPLEKEKVVPRRERIWKVKPGVSPKPKGLK